MRRKPSAVRSERNYVTEEKERERRFEKIQTVIMMIYSSKKNPKFNDKELRIQKYEKGGILISCVLMTQKINIYNSISAPERCLTIKKGPTTRKAQISQSEEALSFFWPLFAPALYSVFAGKNAFDA